MGSTPGVKLSRLSSVWLKRRALGVGLKPGCRHERCTLAPVLDGPAECMCYVVWSDPHGAQRPVCEGLTDTLRACFARFVLVSVWNRIANDNLACR